MRIKTGTKDLTSGPGLPTLGVGTSTNSGLISQSYLTQHLKFIQLFMTSIP